MRLGAETGATSRLENTGQKGWKGRRGGACPLQRWKPIAPLFATRIFVRLSVCHTCESRQNGASYRSTLCTISQIDR